MNVGGIFFMNHNNFKLKCSNEFGMVSEICFDSLKTDVLFGFDPDDVEYVGRLGKDEFVEFSRKLSFS